MISSIKKIKPFLLLLAIFCSFLSISTAQAEWAEEEPERPINENYYRLKKALHYYEALQTQAWPELTMEGLSKDSSNPMVPLLRERLKLTGDLSAENDSQSEHYDKALQQALMHFQARHGLKPDGLLGSRTARELNVSPYERAEEIRRNMDRWAALPEHLGKRFIFINIPEYRFDLVDDNKTVLSMKVIVGKPERPTPELRSMLTEVELNPYWNIPPRIAQMDILPKVLEDPHYLEKMQIKVVERRKSEVIVLDAARINWHDAKRNGFAYEFRQDPGKMNSLGLIKFIFPNEHDVYMHDTPAKELFNRENRIFSSGCIRLEKPFALLSYLLNDDPEWTLARVAEILQKGQLTPIKVKALPIYIIYATAWVDREGVLNFRRDPYNYNEDPNPNDFTNEAKIDDPFGLPLSSYA